MADIDPRLANDCFEIGRFPLCYLLLMNDRSYPWFILVPDRAGIREIYQLRDADRRALLDESCRLGEFLMREFEGDKLNVAALGNQVAQLHLHHIVRFENDPSWPGPIWGQHPPVAYAEDALDAIKSLFALAGLDGFEPHLDG